MYIYTNNSFFFSFQIFASAAFVTLFNLCYTLKSIYDIWNQFNQCNELREYLSNKKPYFIIHLDSIGFWIKKITNLLNDDDGDDDVRHRGKRCMHVYQ